MLSIRGSPVFSSKGKACGLKETVDMRQYLDSAKIHGLLYDEVVIGQIEILDVDRFREWPNEGLAERR